VPAAFAWTVSALLVALTACGGSGASKAGNPAPNRLTGFAGPAFADVVSTASAGDQAKTEGEYWTAERMRNAKPVDLVSKPGKPRTAKRPPAPEGQKTAVPATSPAGHAASLPLRKSFKPSQGHRYPFPYSRYRWSGPTTDLPARTWGKIFFTTPNGDYVCSGTAVTSQNKSVVWTAGHCAAKPGAKSFYSDHWIFVPGYDNGRSPFGRFAGRRFFTTRAWYRRGDSAFDLAAVVVAPVNGKTLVDTVGGQGIAFNQTRAQEYFSGGYPADYPFDGRSLYVCDAPLGNNDRAARPPTIAIGCDMTGGSSGGGWLVNVQNGLGTLVSVNSYGYFSQPDAMYGPYQGNAAQHLYEQASTTR
jgi:V8-like Glu-specific endopeptidase